MYGLLERDLQWIEKAIAKYPEIEEAVIFGSRAMGNYKKGSDVDLAVKGARIDRRIINRLSDDLNEEYPLPYFFDVVHYESISNEELKKHIDAIGKIIKSR
ncbi:MAG: nucleotidyltransferase domain-containing protein [Firmicutes bacterium]|jgi:predicted nucleotidyltransferase|nr:nucleotidyltransferase domain-containing protein [Bacillota bacterium]